MESTLRPARRAVFDVTRAGRRGVARHGSAPGQVFRIVDLEGNQAVDTLFYNARDLDERYSATDTIRGQGNLYLTTGTRLLSTRGRRRSLTIVADTCGRHDTLGGACSRGEQHGALRAATRSTCTPAATTSCWRWRAPAAASTSATSPRNINFFMNVPVTPDGRARPSPTASPAPGNYVEMRAEMDVLVLISNCPQLNNPCNAYNPTPDPASLVWDAG